MIEIIYSNNKEYSTIKTIKNNICKEENSILLNWPATEMPDEVQLHKKYDVRTEIYFIGTLFRHLTKDNPTAFRYQHILDKMTKISPSIRYSSFTEIINDISAGVLGEIDFSDDQKIVYRRFAEALCKHIDHFGAKYTPMKDLQVTLQMLAELIRRSSLEEFIQDNGILIACFVNQAVTYYQKQDIPVQLVIDFYELVTSLSIAKQKILIDNIDIRLSTIKVEARDDELPF